MKKIYLSVVAAALLSSCVSIDTSTTGSTVRDTVVLAQQTAQKACNFLPTLETVSDLLGRLTGQSSSVEAAQAVAQQVCSVVAPNVRGFASLPAQPDRTGSYGRVNGVAVRGSFTD